MWIARVTVKYADDEITKIEIEAEQPKKLLKIVSKIPEEILEVHIYQEEVI